MEKERILDRIVPIKDGAISLRDLVAQYGEDAELYVDTEYDYSGSEVTIQIRIYRLETDEELAQRVEAERRYKEAIRERKRIEAARKKKAREEKKAKDFKTFEAMKKKYGW